MFMNGEYVESIEDLKRCLSLEELVYNYSSGELEIWLKKIGENKKAEAVHNISRENAYMLVRLFEIFEINPEMTEKEVREKYCKK